MADAPITTATNHFRWKLYTTFPVERTRELQYISKSRITATLVGHRIYVHGYDGSLYGSRDWSVACFSLQTSEWQWYQTELPILKNHTTVLAKDALYVFSGSTNNEFYSSDIRRIDLITMETKLMDTLGEGPPRLMFSTADYLEHSNELIVFGGRYASSGVRAVVSNQVFVNSLEDGIWGRMVPKGIAPSARRSHTSCCVGKKLFVYGGFEAQQNVLCDLHVLNCDVLPFTWAQLASNEGFARGASSLSHVAGRVFLFGGFEADGTCVKTLSIYNLQHDEWSAVEATTSNEQDDDLENLTVVGAKSPSSRHSAVCISKGIVFFGGEKCDVRNVTLLEAVRVSLAPASLQAVNQVNGSIDHT